MPYPYSTFGLARAILAIQRALEAEGPGPRSPEEFLFHLVRNLPRDIPEATLKHALVMAAELLEARAAARKGSAQ